MLSTAYNPKEYEENIYQIWQEKGVGSPEIQAQVQSNQPIAKPQVLFASTNKHKIKIFKHSWLLRNLQEKFDLLTLEDFLDVKIPIVKEDTGSFVGDAVKKAQEYADFFGLPVIAQDRGVVEENSNWPGTQSKEIMFGQDEYWETLTVEEKTVFHNQNIANLLQKITHPERKMNIVQAFAIALPSGRIESHERIISGKASVEPFFGYETAFSTFFIPDDLGHVINKFEAVEDRENYWATAISPIPDNVISFLENFVAKSNHSILMPPPNLTGNLHAGHAFQHYLMDTLSRINRQNGKINLWFPGVDHAGIQLEGVINKLINRGEFDETLSKLETPIDIPKTDHKHWYNDAGLVKKYYPEIWTKLAWSKVEIWRNNQQNQSAVLGDTPDYSRQLFTLDEKASKMVHWAFEQYWQDGLIYKGSYLVNWSVGLQTALSDVAGEIEFETRIDPFVNFTYSANSYKIEDEKLNTPEFLNFLETYLLSPNLWPRLQLATVRPETKFTDLAIAMHPSKYEQYFNYDIFDREKLGFDSVIADKFLQAILDYKISIFYQLPTLHNSLLKLIFEPRVDPNFGTGILKITPAHDIFDRQVFEDFLARGLLPNNVKMAIGRDGKLTEVCGEYAGLTVEQGRLAVIKTLAQTGYIPVKTEFLEQKEEILQEIKQNLENQYFNPQDYSYQEGCKILADLIGEKLQIDWNYEHNVTICERSKTVIEPLISEEFFLSYHKTFNHRFSANQNSTNLQKLGLQVVQETQYFSEDYQQRAENFLENIKDWCISRDLIWGHPIPVWYNIEQNYNPNRVFYSFQDWQTNKIVKTFTNENNQEITVYVRDCFQVQDQKPDTDGTWVREKKILDTWFSSCLWPLTTLNFYDYYQNKSIDNDFAKFYPTQEMITGGDIFYQWIVRMMVLGKYFTDQTPFQKVIITPTILDEKGRKMSKSLGNGLDPIQSIQSFSSDSLRLSVLSGMIPNRNMRLGGDLADKMCEKYRNFGNKVWNIARFLESKEEYSELTELSSASIWILAKFAELEQNLLDNLEKYEIAHSVDSLYSFLWDYFANWYIEYLKTEPNQIPFAKELFKQFVILLSPYMPFETEAIWKEFFKENTLLALTVRDTSWSTQQLKRVDMQNAKEFATVVDFINKLRSIRGLFAIDPAILTEIFTQNKVLLQYTEFAKLVGRSQLIDKQMSNLYEIQSVDFSFAIDILSYIPDKQKEIERTNKLIQSLEKQITGLEKQLANSQFLEKARQDVVQEKQIDLSNRKLELTQQIEKLGYLG